MFNVLKKYIINENRKIAKLANRKSDIKMTLMKAFGIIAVVSSHTNGGGVVFPMSNWVSPLFYFMPLFVFVSGYLYKSENDDKNVFLFLYNKFKSMVIPYFIWNIFYGIINTFFRKAGIIDYGDDLSFNSLFIRPWIDGHQFHFNIAAWFLLSLFIDIVCVFIIRKLFKTFKIYNDFVILGITILISIISIYYAEMGYNYSVYLCFIKAGYMLPYFQLGYICKKHVLFITKYRFYWMIGSIFAIGITLLCPSVGVQVVFANFWGNPVLITILTSSCLIFVSLMCEILVPSFENNKIVTAIGDNTFSIMMHHGIVIFLINLAIYFMSGIIEISSFDVEKFKSTLWYCCTWLNNRIFIVYLLLGVFVPIAVKFAYNKLIIYCAKRIEN